MPDPEQIITGGYDNKTARTVAIYEDEAINESALAAMFGQIIADNRRISAATTRPTPVSQSDPRFTSQTLRNSRSVLPAITS